jgi:hypothetical protein
MEAFAGVTTPDQNVVSYLSRCGPYTAQSARVYLGATRRSRKPWPTTVSAPEFTVIRPPQDPPPEAAPFPADREVLVLRSVHGDLQASVVENGPACAARAVCAHSFGTAAIVEQFIDGRALRGVVGMRD